MPASEDLINFDVIESQKENIQSLPGGRSAKALAQIFSSGSKGDKYASPSPNDTRTLNDAIKEEYEAELRASADHDDPLDIYDRYVKWTMNAYPSAQATAESGLLPLLERATKAFLNSSHYRNDPRYLKLWLHYIRLFSDAPRETFTFLARHRVGEELALFYEEYAAYLESVGRWTQAEEVYHLGLQREARPQERLLRKFNEFQERLKQRPEDSNGPSSPALPTVRPALATKVDPFASARVPSDPQGPRSRGIGGGSTTTTKSGKPKMAIYSDADASNQRQPAVSAQSKGWENIGSLRDRRKENTMEPRPWVGETLKTEKKVAKPAKMTIYRDESQSNAHHQSQVQQVSSIGHEHRVREAINPKTGRRERVFVDLDAVYPDRHDPTYEVSFEELRAAKRGWLHKDWSKKEALKEIPDNAAGRSASARGQKHRAAPSDKEQDDLTDRTLDGSEEARERRGGKAKKIKMMEINETQTIKTNFDSPAGSKIKRKSTSEPTMTFHTRAATDEIYSIFNQPLKAEMAHSDRRDSLLESEYEDDDYTSAGESTATGRISAGTSEFGDDETQRVDDEDEEDDNVDADGEWTEFSPGKHVPRVVGRGDHSECESDAHVDERDDQTGVQESRRERFVPVMPEDYNPPVGRYRDVQGMGPNRLPYMTPIIERTESSFPSFTGRSRAQDFKTPCKAVPEDDQGFCSPVQDLLLGTPGNDTAGFSGQQLPSVLSPTPAKGLSRTPVKSVPATVPIQVDCIIKDDLCDPTDRSIRNRILRSIDPPLDSYPGYYDHSNIFGNHVTNIQKYAKGQKKTNRGGDKGPTSAPVLNLPKTGRTYTVRRELGAGAYAPVYLADSVDRDGSTMHTDDDNPGRQALEAIKIEVNPPNRWEFYIIRTAHERLQQSPEHARAADSIIRAHELHVFKDESFLIEDYRGQGTLLDLVNIIRTEAMTSTGNSDAGMDEALAMFFSVELFRTVEALHACGILHGDIKPDNCLVRFDEHPTNNDENEYTPNGWHHKGLTLIDFGRGIDLHAFRPDAQFIADWEIGEHECPEVREGRPWRYQLDLYGVAVTIHTMLFGKYLEAVPVNKAVSEECRTYRLREPLKRYWDRELWSDVFDLLLNPMTPRWMNEDDPGSLHVSMRAVRERMEEWLVANAERRGLALQIKKLEAHFARRRER